MNEQTKASLTAFEGDRRVGAGSLTDVARAAKLAIDRDPKARILIFDDDSSRPIELDLRGSMEDVLSKAEQLAATGGTELHLANTSGAGSRPADVPRGPGRPKLGVVAREVTLLPRHWSWLNMQPGGASVALRKLVEDARRTNASGDRVRHAQESAYRFMSAMAGDAPGFEGATRALFAGNAVQFEQSTASWPPDVRDHARMLAKPAFSPSRATG